MHCKKLFYKRCSKIKFCCSGQNPQQRTLFLWLGLTLHFWGRYSQITFRSKVILKQPRKCEKISSLTTIFKTFFYLDIKNGHLKNVQTILFQLVWLMVSTCRKEARNKRKQFLLDRKFLPTSGYKVFPQKLGH